MGHASSSQPARRDVQRSIERRQSLLPAAPRHDQQLRRRDHRPRDAARRRASATITSPRSRRRRSPVSRRWWSATPRMRTASWSRTPSTGTRRTMTATSGTWARSPRTTTTTTRANSSGPTSTGRGRPAWTAPFRAGSCAPIRARRQLLPGVLSRAWPWTKAEVIATGLSVETEFGSFDDVLKIRDTSSLEPGVGAFKYFAARRRPGPGGGVRGGRAQPVHRDPEPADGRQLGARRPAPTWPSPETAAKKTITFLGEDAGSNDAIGAYTFDPVTGRSAKRGSSSSTPRT